jgi:hypothetical protein
LVIQRLGKILAAQGTFRLVHGAAGIVQAAFDRITFLSSGKGQTLFLLTAQLFAQRLLAFGKALAALITGLAVGSLTGSGALRP